MHVTLRAKAVFKRLLFAGKRSKDATSGNTDQGRAIGI